MTYREFYRICSLLGMEVFQKRPPPWRAQMRDGPSNIVLDVAAGLRLRSSFFAVERGAFTLRDRRWLKRWLVPDDIELESELSDYAAGGDPAIANRVLSLAELRRLMTDPAMRDTQSFELRIYPRPASDDLCMVEFKCDFPNARSQPKWLELCVPVFRSVMRELARFYTRREAVALIARNAPSWWMWDSDQAAILAAGALAGADDETDILTLLRLAQNPNIDVATAGLSAVQEHVTIRHLAPYLINFCERHLFESGAEYRVLWKRMLRNRGLVSPLEELEALLTDSTEQLNIHVFQQAPLQESWLVLLTRVFQRSEELHHVVAVAEALVEMRATFALPIIRKRRDARFWESVRVRSGASDNTYALLDQAIATLEGYTRLPRPAADEEATDDELPRATSVEPVLDALPKPAKPGTD